jgi:hypothetical protein
MLIDISVVTHIAKCHLESLSRVLVARHPSGFTISAGHYNGKSFVCTNTKTSNMGDNEMGKPKKKSMFLTSS